MKVLIICTNRNSRPAPVVPYGACIVADAAAREGHWVRLLSRYGNMSSPSVLFTLRHILDNGVHPGDWCVAASFGAGLSAHALLLRS